MKIFPCTAKRLVPQKTDSRFPVFLSEIHSLIGDSTVQHRNQSPFPVEKRLPHGH